MLVITSLVNLIYFETSFSVGLQTKIEMYFSGLVDVLNFVFIPSGKEELK